MLRFSRLFTAGKTGKLVRRNGSDIDQNFFYLKSKNPENKLTTPCYMYGMFLFLSLWMGACDWQPFGVEDPPSPENTIYSTPVHKDIIGPGSGIRPGRNGDIYIVKNLNKNGSGSLRYGVETARGPRTILFAVSGKIRDRNPLVIKANNLRIAGMTAPWPGIVYEGSVRIRGNNVMMEYMTVLVGNSTSEPEDALTIFGNGSYVFYRCLFGWSRDESLGIVNQIHGVTFKHCIISESLNLRNHAFSGLFHAKRGRVLLDGNLFSHHTGRMPMSRIEELYIANNIFYDRKKRFIELYNQDGLRTKNVIVDNIFEEGPSRPDLLSARVIHSNKSSLYKGTKVYVDGNQWSDYDELFQNPKEEYRAFTSNFPSGDFSAGQSLFSIKGRDRMHVQNTDDYVLANAGPFPGKRFKIAQRIVNQYVQRKGRVITSPSQIGGIPNVPEYRHSFELPSYPHKLQDNGYTRLENWLAAYY